MAKSLHGMTCTCQSCEDWRFLDGDVEDAISLVTQGLLVLLVWIGGLLVLKYVGQIAWGVWGGR